MIEWAEIDALQKRITNLESALLLMMKAIAPEIRRHPYIDYMAEAKGRLDG